MTKSTLWSRMLLTGTLAGGLVLAFNGTARADRDWREDCHRRLESDRARIDRDAARHGENSRQVSNDVARMDNDRRWCRNHRADWDHNHYDMGIYFRHHDDDDRSRHHDDDDRR